MLIHFDQHLLDFIEAHGSLVYALLFLIIFAETGFVIFPFLPGDSLLFVLGTLSAREILDLPIILLSLSFAATIGDSVNFHSGFFFQRPIIRFLRKIKIFNEKGYTLAQKFYAKHGAIAIISVRFLPLLRTFVPFVAGIAKMDRAKFTLYNIFGGLLWIFSVTLLGYGFGSLPIPWMQNPDNLKYIFLLLVLIPGMVAFFSLIHFWRSEEKDDNRD